MTAFENGWAVVGHTANDSIDELYNTLSRFGIKPKEFMLYGDIRTFVRANDLPENEAIAFHKGHYIGTLDQVLSYLNGKGLQAA